MSDEIISKSPEDFRIETRQARIDKLNLDNKDAIELLGKIKPWQTGIAWTLTLLPKTAQTIGLLERWLSTDDGFDIAAIMQGDMRELEEIEEFEPTSHNALRRETNRRVQDDYEDRSLWYIVGTSVLFECLILGFASMIFCRRDF